MLHGEHALQEHRAHASVLLGAVAGTAHQMIARARRERAMGTPVRVGPWVSPSRLLFLQADSSATRKLTHVRSRQQIILFRINGEVEYYVTAAPS